MPSIGPTAADGFLPACFNACLWAFPLVTFTELQKHCRSSLSHPNAPVFSRQPKEQNLNATSLPIFAAIVTHGEFQAMTVKMKWYADSAKLTLPHTIFSYAHVALIFSDLHYV